MWRGWVLIASGQHGYHPEIKDDLYKFIKNYYSYKDANDYLLFEQRSPVYFYFADGGNERLNRDSEDQPIPVPYEDLNSKQKRVFDLTVTQAYKMERRFFTTIEVQSKMTEQEALDSGKYISVVSGKTINDFGRRYMIYKCVDSKLDFIGVVIVGGEAKRSDWTGIGPITTPTFAWNYAPLSIREANGEHWGFDFPLSLYKYFGGTTGATTEPIIAIDPDIKGE